ncbi:hypothetical protein N7476_009277 [Penicillium atrosanguineum]|uniref:Uncharacterized protein n=1 Tax=Penicillium atrosanguineum TaxID=1132637 RepID=A0A9W9PR78_9EURO|nr:hypothetical protein N7476_009277 [Penicillium atrosanguineum]
MGLWNVVGVFSVKPSVEILFYIIRTTQGLSGGVLLSGSMSFSAMADTSPFGFWLGAIQGGALKFHLKWIFGNNTILSGIPSQISWAPKHRRSGNSTLSEHRLQYLDASAFFSVLHKGQWRCGNPILTRYSPLPSSKLHRWYASHMGRGQDPTRGARALHLPCSHARLHTRLSIISTLDSDLLFAAASIYIISNVRQSYQGSAGSLLVTVRNLSPFGDFDLEGLRAVWWFGLVAEIIAALITLIWVRIPEEEEKVHVL